MLLLLLSDLGWASDPVLDRSVTVVEAAAAWLFRLNSRENYQNQAGKVISHLYGPAEPF